MVESEELRVSGTLIGCYYICKREMWLMARNIVTDQDNPYIELGRFVNESTYKRDRKQIHLDNVIIDLTRLDHEKIVVGEIKKSSRAKEAATMQLCYYLYVLRSYGIEAEGELLFPKEKKKEKVALNDETVRKLENDIQDIKKIALQELPPPAVRIRYCTNCAYNEFCWS
ncbi:MAG TPA: CRISPR-associated protein Cas4 [Thermodesulfobacteriota bacterium]|nr:CRISPR-associated protein Cas4 [Thermodesulfobacteriota bacterium]